MIEMNEALVGEGTVLDDFAQHGIKGSCLTALAQIFASQKLLLCSLSEKDFVKKKF